MNRTAYKRGWQFRIEIDSPLGTPPEDFDIYAKDITYDPITIEIEPEKLGGHTFNWPTGAGTTTITMTMRDNVDERIRNWFGNISGSIVNADGTINLIRTVICTVRRFNFISDSGGILTEAMAEEYRAIPTVLGGVTQSLEEQNCVEFPITFVQQTTAPGFK